mgnify:CR=1 FL=1|tara:strand:- start:227 stop:835 length:609 start_codon:yes stop_codon:yes gene_type:complete
MTIKLISFGSECDVRYQISKYLNINEETDFFDWLICDIDSVIDILTKDINKLFTFPNIKLIGYKNNKSIVKLFNTSKLISMHDLPIKYSFNDIYEFILKYKRRYNRLINIIKSNNKVYLIRRDNISNEKIKQIMDIFDNINSSNNITFILLRTDIEDHYIYSKRIININFNKLKLNNNNNWQRDNYAWNLLFDFIFELSKED